MGEDKFLKELFEYLRSDPVAATLMEEVFGEACESSEECRDCVSERLDYWYHMWMLEVARSREPIEIARDVHRCLEMYLGEKRPAEALIFKLSETELELHPMILDCLDHGRTVSLSVNGEPSYLKYLLEWHDERALRVAIVISDAPMDTLYATVREIKFDERPRDLDLEEWERMHEIIEDRVRRAWFRNFVDITYEELVNIVIDTIREFMGG